MKTSKFKIGLALAAFAMLGSCNMTTQERRMEDEMNLEFNVNTRASGTAPESNIDRLRVVVSKSNYVIRNAYFGTTVTGELSVTARVGTHDLHFICNEPVNASSEPTAPFTTIHTTDDLANLQMAYVPTATPASIPMYVKMADQTLAATGTNIAAAPVRIMARFDVTLVIDESDFPAGKYPMVETLKISGLPSHCWYVSGTNYPGTGAFIDSETQTAIKTSANGATKWEYKNTFYVPEYLMGDASKTPKIVINGHTNGTATSNSWSQTLLTTNIVRNNIYSITGNIKGYGIRDIILTSTIVDWGVTDITNILN